MKDVSEMTIGEVAAYIAEHLRINGIEVVLTGGSCVSIYTDNRYLSYDLDFIEQGQVTHKMLLPIDYSVYMHRKNKLTSAHYIMPTTLSS